MGLVKKLILTTCVILLSNNLKAGEDDFSNDYCDEDSLSSQMKETQALILTKMSTSVVISDREKAIAKVFCDVDNFERLKKENKFFTLRENSSRKSIQVSRVSLYTTPKKNNSNKAPTPINDFNPIQVGKCSIYCISTAKDQKKLMMVDQSEQNLSHEISDTAQILPNGSGTDVCLTNSASSSCSLCYQAPKFKMPETKTIQLKHGEHSALNESLKTELTKLVAEVFNNKLDKDIADIFELTHKSEMLRSIKLCFELSQNIIRGNKGFENEEREVALTAIISGPTGIRQVMGADFNKIVVESESSTDFNEKNEYVKIRFIPITEKCRP